MVWGQTQPLLGFQWLGDWFPQHTMTGALSPIWRVPVAVAFPDRFMEGSDGDTSLPVPPYRLHITVTCFSPCPRA